MNKNLIKKPKDVKIWRNSGFSGKKQKLQEQISTPGTKKKFGKFGSPLDTSRNNQKYKKKRQFDERVITGKPSTGVSFRNKTSIKTGARNEAPKQQNWKRKNEFQESGTKKRMKPEGMKRKDWKMLHMDKKDIAQSEKPSKGIESESEKVVHILPKTKKERKKLVKERKGKGESFEVGEILKNLWNEFRREDCEAEKKKQLVKRSCDLVKGRVKEFTFAHDTVRVLECIVMEGGDADRALLFEELKSDILPLAKSKYGKFFLLKMLRYGSKEQKDTIMKTFHGKIIQLIRHTEAAEVVELAFNECANAKQRFEFVQEFYGPTYMYFKASDYGTLKELFENDPEKKNSAIQNMKIELMKVLNKSVVKHSIVHHILWQFIQHCDPVSKVEIIEELKELVPEILHTKDGSRVGMHCVWFGTTKDRKAIVKSMKTFVLKIALEEHGHMVLLALFDCLDDTKLLAKCIIGELEKNLLEISQNVHGRKVLIYLQNPRDPHYIHPDVIDILKTGDENKTSKKDPSLRRSELNAAIAEPLLNLIKTNIANNYKDNAFCLFTLIILQHTVGNRKEAFQAIADLTVEPYTTENKDVHPIEHSGSSFLFKQLIIHDKDWSQTDCKFSEVLIDRVPKCVLKSWIECNRGTFLLVSLIETQLPTVIERVKEDLINCNKYLSKKPFKGAQILLKKLKECN